jgi:UDP-glucose 4-epimerase
LVFTNKLIETPCFISKTFWSALPSGESYHEPLVRISAQRISNGMNERAVIDELEALMTSSEAARDARWESRFNDIPRIVRTALKFQPALSDESTITFFKQA